MREWTAINQVLPLIELLFTSRADVLIELPLPGKGAQCKEHPSLPCQISKCFAIKIIFVVVILPRRQNSQGEIYAIS